MDVVIKVLQAGFFVAELVVALVVTGLFLGIFQFTLRITFL